MSYKTIKQMEKKGNSRAEIIEVLKVKFTEKNPDIKLLFSAMGHPIFSLCGGK